MFYKDLIADSKVQVRMIPVVVLRIAGCGGNNLLLRQPIQILHAVETVSGPILPWEIALSPTYLEVWQIGVAKICKEKRGGVHCATEGGVIQKLHCGQKKFPLFIIGIIKESAHYLD